MVLNRWQLMCSITGTLLRRDNKKVYGAALTLLWLLVMLTFLFDWQYHRSAFVLHNDSPLDIANVVVGKTRVESLIVLDNTLSISCNWLADAMLVCQRADRPYAWLLWMFIFVARFGAAGRPLWVHILRTCDSFLHPLIWWRIYGTMMPARK